MLRQPSFVSPILRHNGIGENALEHTFFIGGVGGILVRTPPPGEGEKVFECKSSANALEVRPSLLERRKVPPPKGLSKMMLPNGIAPRGDGKKNPLWQHTMPWMAPGPSKPLYSQAAR